MQGDNIEVNYKKSLYDKMMSSDKEENEVK